VALSRRRRDRRVGRAGRSRRRDVEVLRTDGHRLARRARAGRAQDRTAQDVLELADVPGPVGAAQAFERPVGEAHAAEAQAPARDVGEAHREGRDVLPALAQRRDAQGKTARRW